MRSITKDIQLTIDGSPQGFRLTKPDAFSGVEILRLLLRLQDRWDEDERNKGTVTAVPRTWNEVTVPDVTPPGRSPTVLDLITSLTGDELRVVMTSCLNHTEVLLPAGPHPVMEGSSWGYPEIEHNTAVCMRLLMEGLSWNLSGFFGGGGRTSPPAPQPTSP